jgi:serine/threonine protein kinase
MAVTCPKCQHENPEDSSFCGKCATPLSHEAQLSFTKTLESPVEIPPGTIFADHYEILEKLGRGGMGEVYRTLDKNLGRQVAIKVLPEEFSKDKERMARFEREAKLLAALNHPNIASIYGLAKHEGRRFLVLELVEGETLGSRLDRGPLSIEETLEICHQIAEGLEAAHEKGIIHRDLKPGNIMLTPEGKVKILDFGLAKAYVAVTTDIDIEKSPTITAEMTAPGVILGTAAYMSPEQARSRFVDKRTDIWAFGCVFYECLAGKSAFQGETVSDTIAQILKGEPDWKGLPQETQATIKTLLRRCLQKDPRQRLHDIADARIEIAEASSGKTVSDVDLPLKPVRSWIWGILIGAPVLAAIAAALISWNLKPSPAMPVFRNPLKIESGHQLWGRNYWGPSRTAFAVASDGSFIVYSAVLENSEPRTSKIYLRKMDKMEAVPVAGTERGFAPFLSPDDQWIGFWEGGQLKKGPVEGGIPTVICDCRDFSGAAWGPDDTIVFAYHTGTGLSLITSSGEEKILTVPDREREESSHRLPHFLPGGRELLFTVTRHGYDLYPRLALLDLKSKEWSYILDDASDGRYLPTGHIVFMRRGVLMAVGFDCSKKKAIGQPVPVIDRVMHSMNAYNTGLNLSAGQYSVSKSGCLVYVPGGIFPDREDSLVRVDMQGNIHQFLDYKEPFMSPRVSPDGKYIAYISGYSEPKIFIHDLKLNMRTQFQSEGVLRAMAWKPDEKRLVFGWSKSNRTNLFWKSTDGSEDMERLTTSENSHSPGSFTPDGKTLVFLESNPKTLYDICLLSMESRQVTPFLNSEFREAWPEISPDGRWLAYASDETGRGEVYVCSFPSKDKKRQISEEGGSSPIWSKDGKQLFYRRGMAVWVADIETEGELSSSKPRMLFDRERLSVGGPLRHWDLWPDGQGFLMLELGERMSQPADEIIIVQNWFEELKHLVPTGKK